MYEQFVQTDHKLKGVNLIIPNENYCPRKEG